MKKFALLLVLVLLTGCSVPLTDNDDTVQSELPNQKDNAATIKPIVASFGNDTDAGYVVGGLVNGELIGYQDNDNYKLFELTGEESYTLFTANGESATSESTNVDTTFVSAVGVYETTVTFDDVFNSENNFIGIGNLSKNTNTDKKFVDDNGSFELDFDGDGNYEKIVVDEADDNVIITLENQSGKTELARFTIDGIYTNGYAVFTIDVDEDDKQEFIICKYGHDYSTEIYDVTSNNCEKIIGSYMGN